MSGSGQALRMSSTLFDRAASILNARSERFSSWCDRMLERRAWFGPASCSFFKPCVLSVEAWRRLLWTDDIFTLHVATQRSVQDLIRSFRKPVMRPAIICDSYPTVAWNRFECRLCAPPAVSSRRRFSIDLCVRYPSPPRAGLLRFDRDGGARRFWS